ncbi:hypothetical protein [Streptomyces sp. NPDC048496]|uniref:hypothetical protein n=1 Tax=Streptomyces sp. NPDC048496 TaxID=3365558 RepID=UPI0037139AAA
MTATTATTDTPHLAATPRAGGGIGGSVRDSLVVAKRNLIRMTRIPNPVRQGGFQFNSAGSHGLRVSAGKGGVQ